MLQTPLTQRSSATRATCCCIGCVAAAGGEAIRDAIFATSGELNRKQFGYHVPIYLTPDMQGRRPAEQKRSA